MYRLGVLGPLVVHGAEGPVAIPGRRERCLLAALAVQPGRVVSTARLFEYLWGDEPPRTAHKSLQTAVVNLRQALRGLVGPGAGAPLATRGTGYCLDLPAEQVDVVGFEQLAASGRRSLAEGSAAAAAVDLSAALELWRGDLPADFGDGLAAGIETQRLVELRLEVLADRIDADLRCGRHHLLLAELGALSEAWPRRERFHEQLMVALYRAGRQADALAAYRRLRTSLVDELGLEPGTSLQALERRILDQDPTLLADGGPPGATAAQVSTTSGPADRPPRVPRRAHLLGREAVLAEIGALVRTRRLVTLVGPGGVGKTTLAEHVAADPSVAGGSVWCSLGPVADPVSVVPALASALGLQQHAGTTMRQAVRQSLTLEPTLLVLDNCEHLLDAVAELVAELLDACPDLTVLATSRERLNIAGESVWPVEGLAVPGGPASPEAISSSAAVQLFVERAREADPHFAVDDAGLAALANICLRLDGMPLALELAAARVRALPPAEIARRLDHRFDLLVGGRREAEPRHRTLRSTVAWSYELLAGRERSLFRRLGHFAGPFTLDAAEAVAATGDLSAAEIPALLADLVDKSMVVVSHDRPAWRYRLLETLRAFARDELAAAGEVEVTESAELSFRRSQLPALGRAVMGPGEADAVAAIEGAFDNIRHTVATARRRRDVDALGDVVGGLAPYLHFHVRWEANDWAESAEELFRTDPPADAGAATLVAAVAALSRWFAGDLDGADDILERAGGRAPPGHPGTVHLLTARGLVMMYRQHPGASAVTGEVLEMAVDAGADWQAGYLLGQLALIEAYGGRPDAARSYLDRQAGVVGALDNPSARAWWLYCRAEVSGESDPSGTVRLARQAVEVAAPVGSNLLRNVAGLTALTVEARHGDAGALLGEFASLIDRFRRDGAWTHVHVLLWNLVEALARIGAHRPAAVLLHAAPPGAPVPYGAQLARLRAVGERLSAELNPDVLAESAAAGAAFSREDAARFAIATLRTVTAT